MCLCDYASLGLKLLPMNYNWLSWGKKTSELLNKMENLSWDVFAFWGLPEWLSGKEPACQCWSYKGTWVWFWVWEVPLEKEMTTHFRVLAWLTPWTEEPGGLQSIGSQRVSHDRVTEHAGFSLLEGIWLTRQHLLDFWKRNQCLKTWPQTCWEPTPIPEVDSTEVRPLGTLRSLKQRHYDARRTQ